MLFIQRLLSRISMQAKLWLGFGLLVGVLAVVVLTTELSLTVTRVSMADVVHRIPPAAFDSMALAARLEHASGSLGFYLLSKEPRQKDDYLQNL